MTRILVKLFDTCSHARGPYAHNYTLYSVDGPKDQVAHPFYVEAQKTTTTTKNSTYYTYEAAISLQCVR